MMNPAGSTEYERLTPLYQRWAESVLPGGIPRERVATCMDCAMCARTSDEQATVVDFYNRDTKCCTYFPDLPNYLVGRAMDVDTPGGAALRAFVEAGSSDGALVTLRGVFPTAHRAALHERAHAEGSFGHDSALLCPYATPGDAGEGPLCGIWEHRNSVCSTYFCKHVQGDTGRHMWMSVRNILRHLEEVLGWWAIGQLIPEMGAMLMRPPTDQAARVDSTLNSDGWKHWAGTRADFYRACSERVEALSWEEVVGIGGFKTTLYAEELRAHFNRVVSTGVPERLRTSNFQIIQSDGARTTLQGGAGGGSEYIAVPLRLMPLLSYFDGRPTSVILSEILEREQVTLTVDLVRKLYNFGVLEEAEISK